MRLTKGEAGLRGHALRIAHCLGACALAAASTCGAGAGAPADWVDVLARGGRAEWAATGGGECRYAEGVLAVRAGKGELWTTVGLAEAGPLAFDLEIELQWTAEAEEGKRRGVELALGHHRFGSTGYQIVVQRDPWITAECRGPRGAPGAWRRLDFRVRGRSLAYRVDGRLAAQSPAEMSGAGDVRLRVGPGAQAAVRRCRFRPRGDEKVGDGEVPRFVYPAADFEHRGKEVADAAARWGRPIEASGAPGGKLLVWGQDASLPMNGACTALFGFRGIEGSGAVRLEVARSGGGVVGSTTVRLEELPTGAYECVAVPFRSEAGKPMEYRARAEGGRVRVEGVMVVAGETAGESRQSALGSRQEGEEEAPEGRRPRRALPLSQAWGKVPRGASPKTGGGAILGISRRWHEGGWYEFRADWAWAGSERPGDAALDLWVACRDAGGMVTTFDYGAAYGEPAEGQHETVAWLDPESCRRYGAPVALFVQLYRDGAPVAASWRKWGIPVDDRYIVEARRVGALRETGEATEGAPAARRGPRSPSP